MSVKPAEINAHVPYGLLAAGDAATATALSVGSWLAAPASPVCFAAVGYIVTTEAGLARSAPAPLICFAAVGHIVTAKTRPSAPAPAPLVCY